MKKTLLLILFISAISNAQIVMIPDVNFKTTLLQASAVNTIAQDVNNNYVVIDTNGDGEIQVSEAINIRSLEIYNSQIANMTGLEAFVELRRLSYGSSQITNLPMSSLVNLQYFFCGGNHSLTALNLSNLTNLQTVHCDYNNLSSLNVTGLSNLHILTCDDNSLTTLNLSGLSQLVQLRCTNNHLSSLNLSGLTNLETLLCYLNMISSLDVTGLTNLKYFHCSNNLLTNLNVSSCINLMEFGCSGNQLTSINVNNLTDLRSFDCASNLLTTLNFTNVPLLMYLYCQNNHLTTLNVSNLPILHNLTCNNNLLTTLDLNNNANLQTVVFMTNPLVSVFMKNGSFQGYPTGIETGTGPIDIANTPLQYMCADEFEINYWQSIFQNTITATTYCTVAPGGSFNTITGSILFDGNNNGCDINDLSFPHNRININDGTTAGASFTNANGNYTFYTSAGNFNLTPNLENPSWFTVSPPTVNVQFPDANNNSAIQNFCIAANGIHPDLEVVIAPLTSARPGFDAVYQVVYKNKGNQAASGNVTFTYNDLVLDFISATVLPNMQSTGQLTFNYVNLMPFESRSVVLTLNVNSSIETPAVNIGDVLNFSTSINPITGDETLADNSFAMNQTVVGAFDPNNKICLEGNIVASSKIGNYLHYNINFENTGTAAATFIVVKDMIDTTKFDINSLRIMNSSHPMTARITGNKIEFVFENINLGAGQHGNVTFKIKTLTTLVTGNTVTNKADIFFDYNFPVATNIASTTFQALSNSNFEIDNSILIYPNPTTSLINIQSNATIKSIQLFDIQGRLLQTSLENNTNAVIDISQKSNGIYFLKITSDKGSKVEKIVKE